MRAVEEAIGQLPGAVVVRPGTACGPVAPIEPSLMNAQEVDRQDNRMRGTAGSCRGAACKFCASFESSLMTASMIQRE